MSVADLNGFAFPLRHSAGAQARAAAIGRRVEHARHWLANILGFEPAVQVEVLAADDWIARTGDWPYGLPHYTAGTVFVSAGPSAFFDDVVALVLRFLPETELARFSAAYGQPPDVQPFVDLLAVHEVAHVFHAEREFTFSPFWVGELFCNLALEGYVVEMEPSERSVLDGFPVAARHIPPTAVQLTALDDMADAEPVNYGWFQGHLHRFAKELWANEGRPLLHTLFDQQQNGASRGQRIAVDDLPDSIRQFAAAWPPPVTTASPDSVVSQGSE